MHRFHGFTVLTNRTDLKVMTPTMTTTPVATETTYDRLADLQLEIDSYSLDGLARAWSSEFTRRSTVVRLEGAGQAGTGEDVTYTPDDHEIFQTAASALSLAGSFTLRSFSEHLDELDLFPHPPQRSDSQRYRRWAFESAALDLALRQAGISFADALGRRPEPVNFVVSMRLPEPPSADPVLERLELYPEMRFKLDAASSWDDALVARLAATGAIEAVDFKGHYEGLPVETAADADLYRRVAEGMPTAWLEDPALTPQTKAVLAQHRGRITWDGPITSVADIAALTERPRMVNVKPSRFGTVRGLLDAYDYLAAAGIGAYGGGQFELGPGRGHVQLLASLFHPEAPNDVAPLGHHAIERGLPTSPLPAPGDAPGFGWDQAASRSGSCCGPEEQSQCCAQSAKSACCGERAKTGTCGCR